MPAIRLGMMSDRYRLRHMGNMCAAYDRRPIFPPQSTLAPPATWVGNMDEEEIRKLPFFLFPFLPLFFQYGNFRLPNNPECAKFASKLRQVLFGAISTQIYYVSTLCVEFALIIRICKCSQIWRMRQRMRRNYAKKLKNCVPKKSKKKKSEPGFEPGISNL